jgi:hypothetical protein
MISTQTGEALASLQARTDLTKRRCDSFELDRIDHALDELVRNHTKTAAAERQVRSARANALKVVQRRAEVSAFSLDQINLHASKREQAESAGAYDAFGEVEIRDWLATTPSLSHVERALLTALADGYDSKLLAMASGTTVAEMDHRIRRAQGLARLAWKAEVVNA